MATMTQNLSSDSGALSVGPVGAVEHTVRTLRLYAYSCVPVPCPLRVCRHVHVCAPLTRLPTRDWLHYT